MNNDIFFEHVATNPTGRVRIYKASRCMVNKADGQRYSTQREKVRFYANKERTEIEERFIPTAFRYVAVSDARTHIERLAFPCWYIKSIVDDFEYFWQCDTIAGVNTFMIHGGDARAVKPDEVYLRMLAKGNGFQYRRGAQAA